MSSLAQQYVKDEWCTVYYCDNRKLEKIGTNFEIMRRALRSELLKRLAKLMLERVGSGAQLTLADVDLENRVLEILVMQSVAPCNTT